jgi:hypothetical protein
MLTMKTIIDAVYVSLCRSYIPLTHTRQQSRYTSLPSPKPIPTIMWRDSTPQEHQCKPMDVASSRDLVEIWLEMVAAPPPPKMNITPYISRI